MRVRDGSSINTCLYLCYAQPRTSTQRRAALGTQRAMASFAAAFADVTPVAQDDGPAPVCAIAYAPEYARLMGFFRAILAPVCAIAYAPEYAQLMGFFRAILESNERSPRVLELTAALAEHNAAHYTVWHVRRECLWALASNDASILNDELRYSAEVARENPKNYQIWYHRRALVEKIGVKAAADELALISTALRDDAKNYHAWSNRLWVLKTYDMWAGELEFCTALLDADVYNNSAWNHLYQVKTQLGCDPVEEVRSTLERLAHAQENESAWVYALAFAKRDENTAAALLAHCEGAEGVRAQAALVELVKGERSREGRGGCYTARRARRDAGEVLAAARGGAG